MKPSELRYYLGASEYKRSSERVRARTLATLFAHPDWLVVETQECACACGSVRHLAAYLPTGEGFLVQVLSDGQTRVDVAPAPGLAA